MLHLRATLDIGAYLMTCNESFTLVAREALCLRTICLSLFFDNLALARVVSTATNLCACSGQFPACGEECFKSRLASLDVNWVAFGAFRKVVAR
jgi:hypothetical protein